MARFAIISVTVMIYSEP